MAVLKGDPAHHYMIHNQYVSCLPGSPPTMFVVTFEDANVAETTKLVERKVIASLLNRMVSAVRVFLLQRIKNNEMGLSSNIACQVHTISLDARMHIARCVYALLAFAPWPPAHSAFCQGALVDTGYFHC